MTASSHNTPLTRHQSFRCGKLDELRETAQSVITDGKMRGFYFRTCVFEASSTSSIMARWWEIKGREGRGDFLHSFPATGGPGHTTLARHVPQLPPCVRQAERLREEEQRRVGGREKRARWGEIEETWLVSVIGTWCVGQWWCIDIHYA